MGKIRNLFRRDKSDDEAPQELPDSQAEDVGASAPDSVEDVASTTTPALGTDMSEIQVNQTRRLPSLEDALLNSIQRVTFGYRRDLGQVRDNNEDSTFTFFASQKSEADVPDFGPFILADGAGGHENGEIASAIASGKMAEHVLRRLYQPLLAQSYQSEREPLPPISEILGEAVAAADAAVQEAVPDGATTLTAVAMVGSLAHIAHVGDSRAYLIRRDMDSDEYGIEKLTRDHTVKQRLHEIGQLTAEELEEYEGGEELWKLMGQTENLEADINARRLPPDSYLLLCSDGLYRMVPTSEMMEIVMSAANPQEACDVLITAANAGGGVDNISAIVVKIPPGG